MRDKGIYYYTTYDNHQISGVDMHKADLDGAELIIYEQRRGEMHIYAELTARQGAMQ